MFYGKYCIMLLCVTFVNWTGLFHSKSEIKTQAEGSASALHLLPISLNMAKGLSE